MGEPASLCEPGVFLKSSPLWSFDHLIRGREREIYDLYSNFGNAQKNGCFCVTQLKLYTGYKLSSPIFCCLWVCQASVTPDQISTFSNIYRHTSPMLTLYHVIPSSASFYWPSTTKYQTVSPYTDPVPAGTTYNSSFRKAQLNNFSFYDSFDESRTVYFV